MEKAANQLAQNTNQLAIELWFLTGRFVAASFNDRTSPEWPPHFARFFSALVSAWAESGEDKREASCLRWIESLGPPQIVASPASYRTSKSHFVPINDVQVNAEAAEKLSLFPDYRPKQERHFPSCTPHREKVVFYWDTSDTGYIDVLQSLLERVTRVGHSSSLTNCRLIANPPAANLVPAQDGELQLRTVGRGQFDALKRMYDRHQGLRPRSLPFEFTRYDEAYESDRPTPISSDSPVEWVIYSFNAGSRLLPSAVTAKVASLFRRALFRYINDPIPEVISGHLPDGRPTRERHIRVVPLPNVGSQHADGRIMGVALAIPHSISDDDRSKLYLGLNDWETKRNDGEIELYFGSSRTVTLSRVFDQSVLVSLRPHTWSSPARVWASATPVALPRHPGKLGRGKPETRRRSWREAERILALCCEHAGFPHPARIHASNKPYVNGASPVSDFPLFIQTDHKRGSKITRCLLHARLEFEQAVNGPIVLGAGQFLGLGLMRPVTEREYTVS